MRRLFIILKTSVEEKDAPEENQEVRCLRHCVCHISLPKRKRGRRQVWRERMRTSEARRRGALRGDADAPLPAWSAARPAPPRPPRTASPDHVGSPASHLLGPPAPFRPWNTWPCQRPPSPRTASPAGLQPVRQPVLTPPSIHTWSSVGFIPKLY